MGAARAVNPHQKEHPVSHPPQALQTLFAVGQTLVFRGQHEAVKDRFAHGQVQAMVGEIGLALGGVEGEHALSVVTNYPEIKPALTPFLIATGDVAVVIFVVDGGWWSIPWAGAGGAMGAVFAMRLHRAFVARRGDGGRNANDDLDSSAELSECQERRRQLLCWISGLGWPAHADTPAVAANQPTPRHRRSLGGRRLAFSD